MLFRTLILLFALLGSQASICLITFAAAPEECLLANGNDPLKGKVTHYSTSVNDVAVSVPRGSTFIVKLESKLNTATTNVGDVVVAKLASDFKVGDAVVAPTGSKLRGHVTSVDKTRTLLNSQKSKRNRFNANGIIGIEFNELVVKGRSIAIDASPKPNSVVQVKDDRGIPIVVDKKGFITVKSLYKRNIAVGGGVGVATAAVAVACHSPLGILAAPVLNGVAGAASPSYGEGRYVANDEQGRKKNGFLVGAVNTVPGGGIATEAKITGDDVCLGPNDGLTLMLLTDFICPL